MRDSTLHKIQKAYKAEISKLDNLPVKDLEPSIVLKTIINRLIEENSLDYARYIANLLNRFCEYCIDIGELKVNRLERLNRAIPAGKARHQPSLNSDNLEGELKELLAMIKAKPLSSQCLFFVSLLTLLRPSEIVGIQLKNIDFDLDYDLALKFMINNLMYDLKITKTDLANKLNISFANLSNKLKLNKTTSLNDLARMFEVLGVPLKISA